MLKAKQKQKNTLIRENRYFANEFKSELNQSIQQCHPQHGIDRN